MNTQKQREAFYPPTTVLRLVDDGRTLVPISIAGKGIEFVLDQPGATYSEQSSMVTLDDGVTSFQLKYQDTIDNQRALVGYQRLVDLDELPAFVQPDEMAALDAQWENIPAMYEAKYESKRVSHPGTTFTVDISEVKVVPVKRHTSPPGDHAQWSANIEYHDVPRAWQGLLPGALNGNAEAFKQAVEDHHQVRSVRIVRRRDSDDDTAVVEFKSAYDDGRSEMVKPLFGRSKKLIKQIRYEHFTTTFAIPRRITADNVDEALRARDDIISNALAEIESPIPCEACNGRGFQLGDRIKVVKS